MSFLGVNNQLQFNQGGIFNHNGFPIQDQQLGPGLPIQDQQLGPGFLIQDQELGPGALDQFTDPNNNGLGLQGPGGNQAAVQPPPYFHQDNGIGLPAQPVWGLPNGHVAAMHQQQVQQPLEFPPLELQQPLPQPPLNPEALLAAAQPPVYPQMHGGNPAAGQPQPQADHDMAAYMRAPAIPALQNGRRANKRRAPRLMKTRSCTACQSSKVKCEKGTPCQRCIARGYECEYGKVTRMPRRLSPEEAQRQAQEAQEAQEAVRLPHRSANPEPAEDPAQAAYPAAVLAAPDEPEPLAPADIPEQPQPVDPAAVAEPAPESLPEPISQEQQTAAPGQQDGPLPGFPMSPLPEPLQNLALALPGPEDLSDAQILAIFEEFLANNEDGAVDSAAPENEALSGPLEPANNDVGSSV